MIHLTLSQLEYLVSVYKYKSFSEGARACHITQPTLSMQIQKAESVLGFEVFDRSKKQVFTTPLGKEVLEQARKVLKEFQGLEDLLIDQKEGLQGKLRLGIIPTLAPYILPQFLGRFLEKYPHIELKTFEIQTHRILEELEKDSLDVGMLALPAEGPFESIELFEDCFYLYLPKCHALLEKKNVSLKDLPEKELFVLSEGHCLRDQVLEVCSRRNLFSGRLSLEVGSLESLIHMVDQGQGITILPALALKYLDKEQKSRVRSFTPPQPARKIGLVYHRRYLRKKVIAALKENLKDMT